MSLHQGQIQKILKEGLHLGNTNLTCLPIPRLKLICDTGYRILEYLCPEIMARPWNTVVIDFRRTSSFKINNQKKIPRQTEGPSLLKPDIPRSNCWNACKFFLWIPLKCWLWRHFFPTKCMKPTLHLFHSFFTLFSNTTTIIIASVLGLEMTDISN